MQGSNDSCQPSQIYRSVVAGALVRAKEVVLKLQAAGSSTGSAARAAPTKPCVVSAELRQCFTLDSLQMAVHAGQQYQQCVFCVSSDKAVCVGCQLVGVT
jgi:hypothetical protein